MFEEAGNEYQMMSPDAVRALESWNAAPASRMHTLDTDRLEQCPQPEAGFIITSIQIDAARTACKRSQTSHYTDSKSGSPSSSVPREINFANESVFNGPFNLADYSNNVGNKRLRFQGSKTSLNLAHDGFWGYFRNRSAQIYSHRHAEFDARFRFYM